MLLEPLWGCIVGNKEIKGDFISVGTPKGLHRRFIIKDEQNQRRFRSFLMNDEKPLWGSKDISHSKKISQYVRSYISFIFYDKLELFQNSAIDMCEFGFCKIKEYFTFKRFVISLKYSLILQNPNSHKVAWRFHTYIFREPP